MSALRWRVFVVVDWLCGTLGHPTWLCRHICAIWTWADPDLKRDVP